MESVVSDELLQTAQANLGQHFSHMHYAQFSQNATHMIVCVAYVHIYVAVFLSCNKTCWEKKYTCMHVNVCCVIMSLHMYSCEQLFCTCVR